MTNFPESGSETANYKLKPCPFCGGVAHIYLGKKQYCQLHGEPYQHFIVSCKHQRPEYSNETNARLKDCKVAPSVSAATRERAIELWNTRPKYGEMA